MIDIKMYTLIMFYKQRFISNTRLKFFKSQATLLVEFETLRKYFHKQYLVQILLSSVPSRL